jgi:hypothetical protein
MCFEMLGWFYWTILNHEFRDCDDLRMSGEINTNDVDGCRKKLSQCARHAGQIVGSLWMMIEPFLY